jgi:type I restriction enzyme, R subunit
VDRRLTLREILEKIFGLIPRLKSKDELLEEEFAKFVADTKPEEAEAIPAIKTCFKVFVIAARCATSSRAATSPIWLPTRSFPLATSAPCLKKCRVLVPEYVKDYVSLNQFAG